MADIVTQLQDSVNEINGMFYNCTGMLQRDAKPAGTTADGELSDALPDDGLDPDWSRRGMKGRGVLGDLQSFLNRHYANHDVLGSA